jgi:eukaryotic-like serine/threonine-protein kinase
MSTSSTILVALLTSVVTAAGTVYAIERLGILPPRAVAETLVPDLHGVSEADARANASTAHIALLIAAREPAPDAKPGTVIRQSIAAGQRVPREYSMSVVLAEEVPRVPKVTGLTAAVATQRLEERGYGTEISTVPSPDVAQGLVVDQSPKADTAQAKGATIALRVSSGPGEVDVPKVVGLPLAQAQKTLEALGVKPVVRWVALAETATYVVLSQKPVAGAKMKPGAEVELMANR